MPNEVIHASILIAIAMPTVFLFAKALVGYTLGRGDEDFILKRIGLTPSNNPRIYFWLHLLMFAILAFGILANEVGILVRYLMS